MNANFNQLLDHASNKENLRVNNVNQQQNLRLSKEEVERDVYQRCLRVIEEAREKARIDNGHGF